MSGEFWDRETHQWRQEESGRTRDEQAAYQRGYEQAGERLRQPWPGPGRVVEVPERERPRVTVLDGQHAVHGRSRDYEAWRRTPGGRFHSLQYPDPAEAYEEHQRETGPEAVRQAQDAWETNHGRRPPAAAVQAMLNARQWDRQGWDGTAQELQTTTRWAFPDFAVLNRGEEPLEIALSTAQVRRP
jgi:hypothetical protein